MNKKVKSAMNLGYFETSPELAEIKVSYKSKVKDFIKIISSRDAFNVLYSLFDENTMEIKEDFIILLLNRANKVLGWFKISSGGTAGTVVDIKIVFMLALLTNSHSIILSHNHPSQSTEPSEADINLTRKIKDAGQLMEIMVLDHLIISSNGSYYSFKDEGKL